MDKQNMLNTGREKSPDSRRALSETTQTMNIEYDRQEMNTRKENSDTSSSTNTSTSSPFDTPEVQGLGRPPLERVRKSKQQQQQILELQDQLLQREEEFDILQQHVLQIMTSESLTNPFPATPTTSMLKANW
jgi:hypothetical protein